MSIDRVGLAVDQCVGQAARRVGAPFCGLLRAGCHLTRAVGAYEQDAAACEPPPLVKEQNNTAPMS